MFSFIFKPSEGSPPRRSRFSQQLRSALDDAGIVAVERALMTFAWLAALIIQRLSGVSALVFGAGAALWVLVVYGQDLAAAMRPDRTAPPTPRDRPTFGLGVVASFSSGATVVVGLLTPAVRLLDSSGNAIAMAFVFSFCAVLGLGGGTLLVLLWRHHVGHAVSRGRGLRVAAWGAAVAAIALWLTAFLEGAWLLSAFAAGCLLMIASASGLWAALDATLGRSWRQGVALKVARGAGMAVVSVGGLEAMRLPLVVDGLPIVAIATALASVALVHRVATLRRRAAVEVLLSDPPATVLEKIVLGDTHPESVALGVASSVGDLPARVLIPLVATEVPIDPLGTTVRFRLDASMAALVAILRRGDDIREVLHFSVDEQDRLIIAVRLKRGTTIESLEASAWAAARVLGGAIDPLTGRRLRWLALVADVSLSRRSRASRAAVTGDPLIFDLALNGNDAGRRLAAVTSALTTLRSLGSSEVSFVASSGPGRGGNSRFSGETLRAMVHESPEAGRLTGDPYVIEQGRGTAIVIPTGSHDPQRIRALRAAVADLPVDGVYVVWHAPVGS
jgi:hypothetical protein